MVCVASGATARYSHIRHGSEASIERAATAGPEIHQMKEVLNSQRARRCRCGFP